MLLTKPDNLRDWADSLMIVWMLGIPFGLFVGAAVGAGENSRGTMPFATAQPAPLWKLAIAKLLAGGVACVTPGMLIIAAFYGLDFWGGTISQELAGGFRHQIQPVGSGFLDPLTFYLYLTLVTTLSIYLWTAALAVNSSDEVRGAVWALGFFAVWLAFLATIAFAMQKLAVPSGRGTGAMSLLAMFGPLGPAAILNPRDLQVPWLLGISGVVHLVVAVAFVRFFGRPIFAAISRNRPTTSLPELAPSYLPPPFRSTARALAWKELRECGPIAGAAVAASLMIGSVIVVAAIIESPDWLLQAHHRRELATMLVAPLLYLGPLAAAIMGIGVTLRDLSPQLNTFWRSRPIPADHAFWIPVATGGALLMICFALPAWGLVTWAGGVFESGNNAAKSQELIGIGAAALLLFFAAGACAAAATRDAVRAAILSLGISLVPVVWTGEILDRQGIITEVWQVMAVLGGIALTAILAAWVLFRSDWPVRG
ncbi:ABC transporter permease subunit [Posidoniimonas polymericola]|nr:ABC transporter permease subunit [Posidoniimonas polymericola]